MQIENDYDKEIYNGDIGYIEDVDPNRGEIVADFDGRAVTYGFGELDSTLDKNIGPPVPGMASRCPIGRAADRTNERGAVRGPPLHPPRRVLRP